MCALCLAAWLLCAVGCGALLLPALQRLPLAHQGARSAGERRRHQLLERVDRLAHARLAQELERHARALELGEHLLTIRSGHGAAATIGTSGYLCLKNECHRCGRGEGVHAALGIAPWRSPPRPPARPPSR
eukprot:scaffold66576_cov64-Phaeocystis_antarctica.AAC.2